jgi:hypothetical protein
MLEIFIEQGEPATGMQSAYLPEKVRQLREYNFLICFSPPRLSAFRRTMFRRVRRTGFFRWHIRVPHISLVFREVSDTTALNP